MAEIFCVYMQSYMLDIICAHFNEKIKQEMFKNCNNNRGQNSKDKNN